MRGGETISARWPLPKRRHDIDHAGRAILDRRVGDFHLEALVRIERRQVVEVDLVLLLLGVFEVDRVDLEQREIALAVLGSADRSVDRVAGAQREAADLGRADIDVVGARQIVRFRRAQEPEAVGQNLDDARAGDFDLLLGELLEDRKHHVLFAHRARVFDLEFFGELEQGGRRFGL